MLVLLALLLAIAPEAPPKATKATPVPATTPGASASRTLVGEVLSVDLPNRKVVVAQALKARDKSGVKERETVTVQVPFSTRVQRGTKSASLADVRPRDHAVVRYELTSHGPQALSLQLADLATPTPVVTGGS
jgi:hypothetical protein